MERRFIHKAEAPVSVETRADGKRFITGHGAVFFDTEDRGTEFELFQGLVERVHPDAFKRALAEKDDARGLFNHDPDNLLGRVSSGTMVLSTDSRGLKYEIEVDPDDADHQRVVRKIERGDLTGSSFAFVPKRQEFIEGEDGAPDVRMLLDVELYDTGPVTYPAYESADTGVRAIDFDKTAEAEVRTAWQSWKKSRAVGDKTVNPETGEVETVVAEIDDDGLADQLQGDSDGQADDDTERDAQAEADAAMARARIIEMERGA